MQFCLLFDTEQVESARLRFPLFYDVCLPGPIDAEDGSTRYALVCDAQHTALAVLRHTQPFHSTTVSIVAMVVRSLPGLHRLLAFFKTFLRFCATLPLVGVSVSKDIVLVLEGDVTHAAVDAAFCEHLFQPSCK